MPNAFNCACIIRRPAKYNRAVTCRSTDLCLLPLLPFLPHPNLAKAFPFLILCPGSESYYSLGFLSIDENKPCVWHRTHSAWAALQVDSWTNSCQDSTEVGIAFLLIKPVSFPQAAAVRKREAGFIRAWEEASRE